MADRNHTLELLAAAEQRTLLRTGGDTQLHSEGLSTAAFMEILIVLTSTSTVNNKILISAY